MNYGRTSVAREPHVTAAAEGAETAGEPTNSAPQEPDTARSGRTLQLGALSTLRALNLHLAFGWN
jgi:hypothetical protein